MAENQLKRYLDAGMQFTQMTQQRAEAIVRELVRSGEVQAEQVQEAIAEVVDRSRKNSEQLFNQVRTEVQKQLSVAEFVTKDVVARLQGQIDELRAQLPGGRPAKKAPAKKAAAKKGPAKKGPAKKAPAKKKAAAKKAPAKKKVAAKKAAG
jgi:polyhydroxyalkanoate synthesis regulator phasin